MLGNEWKVYLEGGAESLVWIKHIDRSRQMDQYSFTLPMHSVIGSHFNFPERLYGKWIVTTLCRHKNWLFERTTISRESWKSRPTSRYQFKAWGKTVRTRYWNAGYEAYPRESALLDLLSGFRIYFIFPRFLCKCSDTPVFGSISSCRQGPCNMTRLIDVQGTFEACQ